MKFRSTVVGALAIAAVVASTFTPAHATSVAAAVAPQAAVATTGTVSAGGITLPGVAPGAATITAGGDNNVATLAVSNAVLDVRFELRDQRATITQLTNKQTGENLAVTTNTWFSLTLTDGTVITDGDLQFSKMPVITDLAADPANPKVDLRSAGTQAVTEYTYNSNGIAFTLKWYVELRDDANYVQQRFELTQTSGTLSYSSMTLLDAAIAGARVEGVDDGSPIVAGATASRESFFFGLENPMSKPAVASGVAKISLPSATPLTPGTTVSASTAIGVSVPGQMKRSFHYYVERERAHARHTFLHYQSWYDLKPPGLMIDAAKLNTAIDTFGQQLTQRGAKIDSFWVDDGWDYLRSPQQSDESQLRVWSFDPTQFPTGFAPQKAKSEQYGASMSVWMSPFGGYGESASIRSQLNASKPADQQYERNGAGFTLAGSKYYAGFKASVFDMIDNQGVRGFKFDGIGGGLFQSGPNQAYIKDYEAMLQLISEMRAHESEVWINSTVGTWASPYWLWYSDSIWRDGQDNGQVGEGSTTQKYMSHRDQESITYNTRQNPLFPTSNLMNHGIVFSTSPNNPHFSMDLDLSKQSVQQEAATDMKAYFGTGLGLQELYVMHEAVAPSKPGASQWWDTLAANAKWARDNQDLLNDSRYIGGMPASGEVYGTAAWNAVNDTPRGTVMLRNPSSTVKTYTIDPKQVFDLPDGYDTRYRFTERDGAREPFVTDSANRYVVQLQPYQVFLFEASPTTDAVTPSPTDAGPIDSSGWTVVSATSEETAGEDGRARNAIDGSAGTIWHTQYTPTASAFPHQITVNTGQATTWKRFDYVPRALVNGSANGLISAYTLETSTDGSTWTTVASGSWDWSSWGTKSITPDAPVTAQYFRLTSTASSNGGTYTTAAELQLWP